jgi:hypothetical protein
MHCLWLNATATKKIIALAPDLSVARKSDMFSRLFNICSSEFHPETVIAWLIFPEGLSCKTFTAKTSL